MTSAALATMLGGTPVLGKGIESPLDWIEALKNGLPPEAFDAAIERGILTRDEANELIIPRRTLLRRKQNGQRLTLEESDKLSRITRLTIRGAETFGSSEDAVQWLRESNGALAGRMPLDLLRSGEGGAFVEQILGRIDQGVYSSQILHAGAAFGVMNRRARTSELQRLRNGA
jgi:putative toxin-antitoxin system antitoxin component (TIGR02293 family)